MPSGRYIKTLGRPRRPVHGNVGVRLHPRREVGRANIEKYAAAHDCGGGVKASETRPPPRLRSVKWPERPEFVDIYAEQSRHRQAEPPSAAQRRELSHAQMDVASRHYEGHALEHRHVVEWARIDSDHIGRFA